MSRNFEDDLAQSNDYFKSLVWPAIARKCGHGELLNLEEMRDNNVAQMLDIHAGIDYMQVIDGQGVRGISSRVQWGRKDWGTFTIRYARDSGTKTEYDKRKEALLTGKYIYPYLTCQAYIEAKTQRLLNAYVAPTLSIFNVIDEHLTDALIGKSTYSNSPVWMQRTGQVGSGGARFIVVRASHVSNSYKAKAAA